jgi:hypothetical protein
MTVWINPSTCTTCTFSLGDLDLEHPSGQKIPKCIFDPKIQHLRLGPFTGKVLCPKRDLISKAGSKEFVE